MPHKEVINLASDDSDQYYSDQSMPTDKRLPVDVDVTMVDLDRTDHKNPEKNPVCPEPVAGEKGKGHASPLVEPVPKAASIVAKTSGSKKSGPSNAKAKPQQKLKKTDTKALTLNQESIAGVYSSTTKLVTEMTEAAITKRKLELQIEQERSKSKRAEAELEKDRQDREVRLEQERQKTLEARLKLVEMELELARLKPGSASVGVKSEPGEMPVPPVRRPYKKRKFSVTAAAMGKENVENVE